MHAVVVPCKLWSCCACCGRAVRLPVGGDDLQHMVQQAERLHLAHAARKEVMNGQKDLDLGDSCGVNDTAGGGPHLAHAAGQQKRCARTETTQTNAVSPVAKAAPQAQSDSRGSAKAYFAAGPTCSATTPRAASCSGVGSGQLLSEGRTRRGKHMGWETVVGLQADAVLDGRSDGSPTAAQFDSLGGVLLFFCAAPVCAYRPLPDIHTTGCPHLITARRMGKANM